MAIKQKTTYQKYMLDILALYQTRPDLKAYLELLLSIFTITLFAVFAIRPTLVTVGELLTEINTKKETLATLTQKADNLATAQNLMQKQQKNIDLLNLAIPASPLPQSYVRQIEGLAQKDQITITNSKTGEVKLASTQKATTGQDSFEVSFSGKSPSYSAIAQFALDIENLLRPSSPTTVTESLTKTENSNDFTLNYSANIPFTNQ